MEITRNNFLAHYPGHADLGHVIERNAAGRAVQIGDGENDLTSAEAAVLVDAGLIWEQNGIGFYVTNNGRARFMEGARVFGVILRSEMV